MIFNPILGFWDRWSIWSGQTNFHYLYEYVLQKYTLWKDVLNIDVGSAWTMKSLQLPAKVLWEVIHAKYEILKDSCNKVWTLYQDRQYPILPTCLECAHLPNSVLLILDKVQLKSSTIYASLSLRLEHCFGQRKKKESVHRRRKKDK